uniref:sensor N-terminal transmembrane domain-containing protein n=1 Tax=Sphingomonas bacterium TaxID=1895847 RepID=UPI001576CA7A
MAQATVSRTGDGDLALRWSGRISLTRRILAVNIFALALLAGGFFYLDSYRSRIVDSRLGQSSREVRLIAEAIAGASPPSRSALIARLARDTGARIRLYDRHGATLLDSRSSGIANLVLLDPTRQGWQLQAARWLDAAIDTVVAA